MYQSHMDKNVIFFNGQVTGRKKLAKLFLIIVLLHSIAVTLASLVVSTNFRITNSVKDSIK